MWRQYRVVPLPTGEREQRERQQVVELDDEQRPECDRVGATPREADAIHEPRGSPDQGQRDDNVRRTRMVLPPEPDARLRRAADADRIAPRGDRGIGREE